MIRITSLRFALLLVGSVTALPVVASSQTGRQMSPRREALERQLQTRTGDVVRRRLGLTDEQMTQLQSANRQFDQQRVALFQQERETRQELRRELLAGERANQSRVQQLIDQTFALERQRLDLMQSEQRELAKFLTPVQRAKLIGLQGEMRRRAQQLRR